MSYDTGAVSPWRQEVETDGESERVREIECFISGNICGFV